MRWLLIVLLVCLLTPRHSLARTLTVVLDPGHGGSNRGAFGKEAGHHEKVVTLSLAKECAARLRQRRPDIKVVLTRADDRYLTLDQRVRKANGLQAKLFVSLHFNASPLHSMRGFETFILSQEDSRHQAAAAAYRARKRGGGAVAGILAELKQSAAHGEAALLARRIQRQLRKVRSRALDRGVRQAPFDVLQGLKMPGALVEVGFIDHPREGPKLVKPSMLSALAGAVAEAIAQHLPPRPGS